MHTANYFVRHRPNPGSRLRLFCFPYAGGSALNFLSWHKSFGPEVEICALQLPGRGARLAETPHAELEPLVRTLAREIRPFLDRPYAFFGHSLGGLLAFELARRCALDGLPAAERLFASGCEAPQCRKTPKYLCRMPDAELIAALRDYNGTPPEVLENKELMNLCLPFIRADFALVENYAYREGPPLDVPITVLAGRDDPGVAADSVPEWRRETAAGCRVEWFDGDHFFIQSRRSEVIRCVADELKPVLQEAMPMSRKTVWVHAR